MSCPVAERASTRTIWLTSFSVGMIFSSDASTMCTCGRIWVRSPLPSLVTMTDVPVSATRKLAPVMPTSAARKRSRRMARASASSDGGSERSRSGGRSGVHAAEIGLDLVLGEMDGRRDDVARRLVANLDDVFAEIGLDRLDAVLLEVVVERDLLRDHRLALGDGPGADPLADVEHDVARLRRGLGVVHLAAGLADLLLVGLEVEVEMGERVVLDVAGAFAQPLELGQLRRPLAPASRRSGCARVRARPATGRRRAPAARCP